MQEGAWEGGCYCGAVRYRTTARPTNTSVRNVRFVVSAR